jgi:hypothetical protein
MNSSFLSFDLWLGSDRAQIYCFSLKTKEITGTFFHNSSHHYLSSSSSSSTAAKNEFEQHDEQQALNVTLIKTTQTDTFFLWTYVHPGSTIYLWNHVSKKIMSSYNCRKIFDEHSPHSTLKQQVEFRICDMNFMNGNLYCATSNGIVLALKRLTLTPLHVYTAHVHLLHNLCPITFETRLTSIRRFNNSNPASTSTSTTSTNTIKKTQNILATLGRALAPIHEDVYLSSTKYRLDALQKYANCLILNSWNLSNDN